MYVLRVGALAAMLVLSAALFAQTIDPTFQLPTVLRQGEVKMIRPAPDGKLYVLGDFDYYGTRAVGDLVRLTSTGQHDPTFNAGFPEDMTVREVEVLSDGRVLVVANSIIVGMPEMYMLDSNGNLLGALSDNDGSIYAATVEPLSDGTYLLGDYDGSVWRLDGFDRDPDFRLVTDNLITDIEVLGSKIYVCGHFNNVYDSADADSGYNRNHVARFNFDGSVDQSFNANTGLTSFGRPARILVQPDGKVIPLNAYSIFTGTNGSIRLNSDGSLDAGFAFGYPSFVIEDAYYNSGKITAVSNRRIVRVNADGSADNSFQPVVFDPGIVRIMTLSDNSVVAGNMVRGTYGMARYDNSGTKIGFSAQLMRYGIINAMDRTATSIFIAGDFIKVNNHLTRNVARLNPNGSVLTKFKVSTVYSPVIGIDAFADAKSIIGTATSLYRLVHDGTFDPSFNYVNPGLPYISEFIVQNDGKVLVGAPAKIFRVNTNGSKDLSFNAAIGGLTGANYFDFDLDRATGKILFSGQYTGGPSPQTSNLTRLNPNGSIDPSFVAQFELPNSYSAFERVSFIDNLNVIGTGLSVYHHEGESYYAIRINADGQVDDTFLENYIGGQQDYGNWEVIHKFGDRVILGINYFYSQQGRIEVLSQDGVIDEDFRFPSNMVVDLLTNFYSDNTTDLFVLGQMTTTVLPGRTSIIKLNYTPASPLASTARSAETLAFYPNPSKDFITLSSDDEATVAIFDQTGYKVLSHEAGNDSRTVDVTRLPQGRYIIQLTSKSGITREQFFKE